MWLPASSLLPLGFDPSERVLDAVMAKVPVEKKEANGG